MDTEETMTAQENRRRKRPRMRPVKGNNASRSQKALQHELEMHRRVFDSIYNGGIVTDPDGYVLYFNKPYGEFLGLDP